MQVKKKKKDTNKAKSSLNKNCVHLQKGIQSSGYNVLTSRLEQKCGGWDQELLIFIN